jgi:hypothetical protein
LLVAEDMDPETLRAGHTKIIPPLHGALLKNEQDVHLFERLAFMARRRSSPVLQTPRTTRTAGSATLKA